MSGQIATPHPISCPNANNASKGKLAKLIKIIFKCSIKYLSTGHDRQPGEAAQMKLINNCK